MKIRQFALGLALILAGVSAAESAPPKETWIGAWGFVPTPLPPGFVPPVPAPTPNAVPLAAAPALAVTPPPGPPLLDNPGNLALAVPEFDPSNITIRQLVRVAVAGKRLRIRISNEGGSDAMVLGAVHVGAAGPDGTVLPGSDHAVTFDGKSGVVVPAGAPLLSDAVAMRTGALQKLVISIHVPGVMSRTGHALYQYVAGTPGDHTAMATLPSSRIMRLPALVTQVETDPVSADSVVVAFGDSITEGAASTNNAFRGWPDRLAERLAAAKSKWSVVNAGIGGNRLLRTGTGPGALARLDRDVFSVAGVKAVILLEGINDIGRGFTPTGTQDPATLEALIAADKQFIARCHAHGIKVYGALLTPYGGAGYASPAGEAVRTGLNNWIRTSGAFDGVVDFATPTGDPANPLTFRADYNLRDKLHPNDAGYEAMANAIDLGLFGR